MKYENVKPEAVKDTQKVLDIAKSGKPVPSKLLYDAQEEIQQLAIKHEKVQKKRPKDVGPRHLLDSLGKLRTQLLNAAHPDD